MENDDDQEAYNNTYVSVVFGYAVGFHGVIIVIIIMCIAIFLNNVVG